MQAKQRWDSYDIKAVIDPVTGFLSDTPVVARIGLQVYNLPDGTVRREFRPASEVFSYESMATFSGKPVTVGHVNVTSDNAKEVSVGSTTGQAFRTWDGEDYSVTLQCPLTVFDKTAIAKAVSGQNSQISVGYTSIDIDRPGWGNELTGEYFFTDDPESQMKMDATDLSAEGWVEFDAVQTTIRVNHIALVFKGRAGVAKLNLDAEQDFPYDDSEPEKPKEDSIMTVKIKLDGEVEHEVPEAVATHIATLQAKAAKADSLEAERDQLKVKVDGIPALVDAEVSRIKQDAEKLQELVKIAADAGVKTDGLDSRAIKVAYIKATSGLDVSTKEDGYIDSSFDFAVKSDKMAAQRIAVAGGQSAKNDAKDDKIIDPQQRFRAKK